MNKVFLIAATALATIGASKAYAASYTLSDSEIITTPIVLSGYTWNTFIVNAGTGVVSGIISGGNSNTITEKLGNGTLVLSGENTFSGNFRLAEGGLVLGHDRTLGDSYLEISSGTATTIYVPEDRTIKNQITGNGTLILDIAAGKTLTVSGDNPNAYNQIWTNSSKTIQFTSGGSFRLMDNPGIGLWANADIDFSPLAQLTVSGNNKGGIGANGGIQIGDYAVISQNKGNPEGGGIEVRGGDVVIGSHARITNNEAKVAGGAISSAFSHYYFENSSVAIGAHAVISGNISLGGSTYGSKGGAILASTVSLHGNTRIENNTAYANWNLSAGGAIFACNVNLDTTAGDILFSGNIHYGTYYTSLGPRANSIAFNGGLLNISGGGNVYFDDPISSFLDDVYNKKLVGNSMTINTSGFVQFLGANTLNDDTIPGGAINLQQGTLRIAAGASFHSDSTDFIVRTLTADAPATLAGDGTIFSGNGFAFHGANGGTVTLSPDGDVFDSAIHFGGTTPEIAATKRIGTLVLGSSLNGVAFDHVTLNIDFDNGVHDQITTNGSVTFDNTHGNNTLNLNIAQWKNGTYDIVHGTSLSSGATATFNPIAVTITGLTLPRQRVEFVQGTSTSDPAQQALQVKLSASANYIGTWNGTVSSIWDDANSANWTNGADAYFLGGDVSNFDGTGASTSTIAVNDTGVSAAGLFLSGSAHYTFTGGGITTNGTDSTLNGTAAAGGKLVLGGNAQVDGTVASASFSGIVDFSGITGANNFSGGVDILGGTLRISQSSQLGTEATPITLGSANIAAPATLQVAGSGVSLAQNFVLGGAAQIRAESGASLVIDGTVAARSGETAPLTLAGKITFNKSVSSNDDITILAKANVAANQGISGAVVNRGTLRASSVDGSLVSGSGSTLLVDSSGLAVTGNATLDGTTLVFDSAPEPGAISITGMLDYGTATVNTVRLNSFLPGTFDLLSAGNAIDPAKFVLDFIYNQERQVASLQAKPGAASTLQVTMISGDNRRLAWTGDATDTWDRNNWNWQEGENAFSFADGDSVIFDGTGSRKVIGVTNELTISDMAVTGGEYVFYGEKITANANSAIGDRITPQGRLTVSGNNTWVFFANDTVFERGVEIALGSSAVFNNLTGSLHNEGAVSASTIRGNVTNRGNLVLAKYELGENGLPRDITTGSGYVISFEDNGRLTVTTPNGGSYGSSLQAGGSIRLELPPEASLVFDGELVAGSTVNLQILGSLQKQGSGTLLLLPGEVDFNEVFMQGGGVAIASGATTVTVTLPDLDSMPFGESGVLTLATVSLHTTVFAELPVPENGIRGNVVNDGMIIADSIEGEVVNNFTLITDRITGGLTTSGGSVTTVTEQIGHVNNDGMLIAGSITGDVMNKGSLIVDRVVGSLTTVADSTAFVGEQIGDVSNAGLFNVTTVRGNITNASTGTIKLVGDGTEFRIEGTLINNGHLDFVNAGNTFTITGDLIGSTGATYTLDVDPSGLTPSDKLVVGGNISGVHHFNLRFSGDPNSITRNPMAVSFIEAPNDIPGDETLVGTMDAGLYQFSLTPGGVAPGSYTLVATGYSPVSQAVVNTTGAIAIGWFSQLDSLLKRMGDLRLSEGTLANGDFWVRGYGQQTNTDLGIAGMRDFREYQYGADLGSDWIVAVDANHTLVLGVFVGYQGATRRFRDDFGSKGETDSVYGGLYATWMHTDGWFADGVIKGQRFHNSYTVNPYDGSFDNYGLGASIDFGKQLNLGDGWFAEPSLQFSYAHIFSQSYSTGNGLRVTTGDSDLYRFAGVVRVGKTFALGDGMLLQPYAKIGIEEQLSDGGSVRIATERFRPNTDGTRGVAGVGVIWQLDAAQQVHLDYETSWGDKYDTPWSVNAGYRLRF